MLVLAVGCILAAVRTGFTGVLVDLSLHIVIEVRSATLYNLHLNPSDVFPGALVEVKFLIVAGERLGGDLAVEHAAFGLAAALAGEAVGDGGHPLVDAG